MFNVSAAQFLGGNDAFVRMEVAMAYLLFS